MLLEAFVGPPFTLRISFCTVLLRIRFLRYLTASKIFYAATLISEVFRRIFVQGSQRLLPRMLIRSTFFKGTNTTIFNSVSDSA
jgi:hypothetical protein